MRYLTDLNAPEGADGYEGTEPLLAKPSPETPGDNGADTMQWTEQKLRRFIANGTKTADIVGEVLDVISAEPGRKYSLDELAALTEWERNTLRRVWTHLSRHLNKHFGGIDWPLNSAWGGNMGLEDAQYYWVSPSQAARWNEARSI